MAYANISGTRSNSNGIVRDYTYGEPITVTGQTYSPADREYEFPLPTYVGPSSRAIRVTKTSADILSNGANSISFKSYTEIIEDKLTYPNSAYFYVRANAEQFAGKIPSRAYELNLLKIQIPDNYDPHTRTYTGLWSGTFVTAWSNNPAWVFFDLATNPRYGLGQYITEAQIDKWSLYTIAKYCDEVVDSGFGYKEPRFSCNLYLQTREEAYTVLQNLASVFRGLVYWNASQLVSIQDSPKEPVALFSQSNVIDGQFSYSGSSQKARHSVALVSWNDPEDLYRTKVEYVDDRDAVTKYGIRQLDVVATGCTSRGQAHRLGKWMLFSEQTETEVVSFKAGLENAGIVPGDVISVLDSYRAGIRYSGRLQDVTSTTIRLDDTLSLETGVTYSIMITLPVGATTTLPDGSTKTLALGELYENTFTVGSTGAYDTITISPAFSTIPLVNSVWAISKPTLVPQEFKVISVVQIEDTVIECTALEHNDSKFAAVEQNLDLVIEANSISQYSPDRVTDVTTTETLRIGLDGSIKTDLILDWEQPANAKNYVLEVRSEHTEDAVTVSTSWLRLESYLPDSGATVFDVIDEDTYYFRVFSLNDLGGMSEPYETTTPYVVIGKTAVPEDVLNFSSTVEIYSVRLTWDAVSDVDISYYEIRSGVTWSSGPIIATGITGLEHTVTQQLSGSYDYMIKAVDTTGNVSDTETSTQVVISNPDDVSNFVITKRTQDMLLSWNTVTNSNLFGYEVRQGSSWGGGAVLATGLLSDSLVVPLESSLGLVYYNIKAIDSAGNYSDNATQVAYTVVPPGTVADFSITKKRTDMLLSWTAEVHTTYEVRAGASWDGGTVLVTDLAASTYSVDEEIVGTYNYYIKSTDIVGNVSSAASYVSISLVSPSEVTNFVVVQSGDRTEFAWDANSGAEFVTEYEIRQGTTWSSSVLITNASTLTHTIRSSYDTSTITYLIKAIAAPGIYADTAVSFTSTDYVASPTVGNILYTTVQHDASPSYWDGNHVYMSAFNTSELKQDNDTGACAEYLFEANIGSSELARNSLTGTFDIVDTDTDTWLNSSYTWASAEAGRAWLVAGANSTSVSFTPQICRDIGLNSGEVEGFGLNSTTTSYSGTAATASGVTYDFARFTKGLVLDSVTPTQVKWVKSATASNFSTNFWLKVVDLYDVTYMTLYNTSSTKYLRVKYDNTAKTIILEDSAAVQLSVSITLESDDYVLIGIDQTATDRTLYVGRLYETALSSTASTAPIDTFDEVRLY